MTGNVSDPSAKPTLVREAANYLRRWADHHDHTLDTGDKTLEDLLSDAYDQLDKAGRTPKKMSDLTKIITQRV